MRAEVSAMVSVIVSAIVSFGSLVSGYMKYLDEDDTDDKREEGGGEMSGRGTR